MTLISKVNKPKTHKGRRILENRAPKIVENDKRTLVIKGGHTSIVVTQFLKDVTALKQPLVMRLKWRNPILPFEDTSFIEKMCTKYDCSMFIVGLHSTKRPHNIIIGRLHDGEVLDMYELGIKNYKPLCDEINNSSTYGAKPMLLFSGEAFDTERKYIILKSLLAGPTIENVRSLGIEHQMHFVLRSGSELCFRVHKINLQSVSSLKPQENTSDSNISYLPPLRTPQGKMISINIEEALPSVDFELRRSNIPSEDKWKRALRVPPEVRKASKAPHNKNIDVFGSRVGRIHVGKSSELQSLRPGPTLRTALTGHRKRGFDKPPKSRNNSKITTKQKPANSSISKRRKLYTN